MPKVFVTMDEAWPIFNVHPDKWYPEGSVPPDWEWEAEISNDDIASLKEAARAYYEWQKKLQATRPKK